MYETCKIVLAVSHSSMIRWNKSVYMTLVFASPAILALSSSAVARMHRAIEVLNDTSKLTGIPTYMWIVCFR